ncbi:uncharacterized protein LOC119765253 isoform X2 [Culex quinquefasciatus]|uniref:uncharacterized protein LOC119765253 isoform X2 n=1 Tax=Culex quinquefasciatus TaxID=7176 RepID=UPI0018E3A984|nr:uncharacterized protein LOC119765253 isoform X2 [Culex quinquefasciatus]
MRPDAFPCTKTFKIFKIVASVWRKQAMSFILKMSFSKMASKEQERRRNEVLINLVRNRPILFAKKSRDYRQGITRCNTWIEVAKETGEPIEKVQKRWRNLRDRFCKTLRAQEDATKSGAGASSSRSSFEFFQELMFIKDHVTQRETQGNYTAVPANNELLNEDIEIIVEEYLEEDGEESPETEEAPYEQPVEPVDIRAPPVNAAPSASPGGATTSQSKRQKLGNHMDSMKARDVGIRPSGFALMLTERMAQLPRPVALQLEMEILKLVNDKLMEAENPI